MKSIIYTGIRRTKLNKRIQLQDSPVVYEKYADGGGRNEHDEKMNSVKVRETENIQITGIQPYSVK